jgi:hypothetical protein
VAYGLTEVWGGQSDAGEFARTAPEGDVLERYVHAPFISNNGYMLSREAMLSSGMYREDLTNREDVELLVRLSARLPFRFCGSFVARVRRVDSSARSDYSKFLAQGARVISYLRSDPVVRERLGPALERLEFRERLELCRALYKQRRYVEFRRAYRQIVHDWPARGLTRTRYVRRYVVSLFRDGNGKAGG